MGRRGLTASSERDVVVLVIPPEFFRGPGWRRHALQHQSDCIAATELAPDPVPDAARALVEHVAAPARFHSLEEIGLLPGLGAWRGVLESGGQLAQVLCECHRDW